MQTANTPITDQLANISPMYIVGIVLAFTLLRVFLTKIKQPWARTVSETCDTINFVLILAFLLIRPFIAQAFYIPSESMESTLLVQDRLIVDKFSYRTHQPHRHDVVVFNAPPAATTTSEQGVDFIKRLIGLPGDKIEVKAPHLLVDGQVIDTAQFKQYMPGGGDGLHGYLKNRFGLQPNDSLKIFPDHLLANGTQRIEKEEIAEKLGRHGSEIVLVPGKTIVNGQVEDETYTKEDPDYHFPEDGSGPITVDNDRLFVMGDNRNMSHDSHVWGQLERNRIVGHAVVVFWPLTRLRIIK